MKHKCEHSRRLVRKGATDVIGCPRSQRGQTLAEVLVAVGVLGSVLISLFVGFTSGYAVLKVARENLRATQILEEKMEVIRLIKWDDVHPGFIPTSFTDTFDPTGSTNGTVGITYSGTVTVTNAPITDSSYASHLKMVQINLTWTSGNVQRQRQMTTYVSEYGMQHYIY